MHLAPPDLIEEAMLLGLEMGLARDRDQDNGHQLFKKRDNHAAAGPLWFGPRLGRRKRSLDDEDYKFEDKNNDFDEDDEEFNDLLKTSPWAIIPLRAKCKCSKI